MASVLSDLTKQCLEKLINGAIAEARHVFCFTCITKEYEEERARLEAERITLCQRANVAIRRDKDIQAKVGFWEDEADKLIQEDTKTNQTCAFGFFPDCIWRYKRGKELANNLEEIKRLIEKADKLESIELPRRLPDVERYSSQNYISFKSRETKYKELLDVLQDDNNYITGLQGMGGTGKTTLVKEVGKELKQSEKFSHVIDTTVSFTPDIKKIQDDIAGPLGLKWEDCNESDRPKKLWSRLTNGEKILLIMDDVWDQDPPLDFDAIGIPKQDNHKGCRVILTSRSKKTFNKMDCDRIIELDLLSEEDAWMMFKIYAGICNNSSQNLISKGLKIAKECKQLPVAIAVIASSLKGQQHRVHEWDVTLKSLKKPISMHGVDDDMVGIYKCLKFSYDHMKDEKAKRLFLLCSVFREDEEISIEVLTRLWIGSGLFGEDYGSYDDARNQVVVAKNKLLDSCLLLGVREKIVKMHDLVRDVAQWIANKEIQGVNFSDKNQKALVEKETNIKHLLCEGKNVDFFSWKFDGSKLETLIVKVYGDEDSKCIEVPNSFFENTIKLRVLYFSGDYMQPLSLPHSIRSLTNVRSILVDDMDLGDISILGNLQSLETLDLSCCTIDEFPNGIAKLKNFKLLNLENCEIRRNNPFEVIERCSTLEELYFINSFNDFCQEITLPELRRYHIRNGKPVKNGSLSKYLILQGFNDILAKGTLKYCMQTTEVLWLNGMERGWKNLMPEIVPIEQDINDLVDLRLNNFSQLQFLIDSIGSRVPNVFSKLIVLKLERMENLEELFNGPISFDSLKNLEKLSIKHCGQLRRLFKCKLNLCNLKTMKIQNCPMLVSIIQLETLQIAKGKESTEEIDDTGSNINSRGSMFSKLKVLNIEGCPQLELIFPFLSAQDFPVLDDIRISRCDELKYIFGKYQHVELGSLRQLKFYHLPKFIDIFRECNHPMSSCVKRSSSISDNGSKAETKLDPFKCNIFCWTHICCHGDKYTHIPTSATTTTIPLVDGDQQQDCSVASESNSYCLNIWKRVQYLSRQSNIMCNIKKIELCHLSLIKSVFIPRMLLETLLVRNCDGLKHVLIDTGDHDSGDNNWGNVFPKLKELIIEDCMQLEYIIGQYDDDHQIHTEIHLHLPALESLCLCNLPSLVSMCPKQYHITFPPLKVLVLNKCSPVANFKYIGDFITHHSITRHPDGTIMKDMIGNKKHFLALESLVINNSEVESIFSLNELHGQQKINLGLLYIDLQDLHMMTCLFVGPRNSFSLKNLTRIKVARCEKLESVFSISILRCLQQLHILRIEECKELKHIIEDDLENYGESSNFQSTNTCFPKLEILGIVKCDKLKCVFPMSMCKEFPELRFMMIREADGLVEIFKSGLGDNQKVKIPHLNVVAFLNLPSLIHAQGIQFQDVKHRFVQNCQKLSLTSAVTPDSYRDIFRLSFGIDYEMVLNLYRQLQEESKGQDTGNEYPSAKTTKDFAAVVEVEEALRHEFTSSQMLKNEQSTDRQQSVGEIGSTIKPSQVDTSLNGDSNHGSLHCGSLASSARLNPQWEVADGQITIHYPSIAITKPLPTQDVDVKNWQETSNTNDYKGDPSQIDEEREDGDGQIATTSFSIEITETNDQVSRNDDTFKKVSSNIEEQFPKDDDIIFSKFPVVSQFPSKGDPSQIDLSAYFLVKSELEQLVSKNHLDYKNLSYLTDFLVNHPSVYLRDTSLSNRYKGCAYNLLAELLKFLDTHSVLEVLGACHSKFVDLLQDARSFGFDRDWLDGVERRALFHDIQVSRDGLQKLLASKQQVTKEVEVLRLKMEDLNHQLTSSNAVLESIIQQEAALRAPIGY